LTAEAIVGCREKCINAGMDDFVAKPVKLEDLMATLEKHLPTASRYKTGDVPGCVLE
jgi:CheY-like chemotaxis protein